MCDEAQATPTASWLLFIVPSFHPQRGLNCGEGFNDMFRECNPLIITWPDLTLPYARQQASLKET